MLYEENTVTLEQKTRFTTVSVINIQKQAAIPPQRADPLTSCPQKSAPTWRNVTGQQQHITMVKTVTRSNLDKLHLDRTCLKYISPQNQNNKYNLYENNFLFFFLRRYND